MLVVLRLLILLVLPGKQCLRQLRSSRLRSHLAMDVVICLRPIVMSLLKGLLILLGLFFHFLKIQAKWYQLTYERI